MSHEQPDKVPLDLGGTVNSSIVLEGYKRLKKHLGIETQDFFLHQMMRVVDVDERILQELDIDARHVGATMMVAETEPETYQDIWGIEREKITYYYDQKTFPLAGSGRSQPVSGL